MSLRKVWVAIKTPLTMLVLLAFVAFAAWWSIKQIQTPIPKRPADPCVVQSVGPALTAKNTTVYVYNGAGVGGLAKRVGMALNAAGFRVMKRVNAETPVAKTYIAGIDAKSPEVVLVKSYFPTAVFKKDALKLDHSVDVFLGKDYKALNPKPLASVPVAGGKACLPVPSKLPNTTEG